MAVVVGSKTKWKWSGFFENCKPGRHPTFNCFLVLPLGLSRVPYQLSVTGLEAVQLGLGDLTFHNRARNERKIKIQSEHWHKGHQLNRVCLLIAKFNSTTQAFRQNKQVNRKKWQCGATTRNKSITLCYSFTRLLIFTCHVLKGLALYLGCS